MPLPVNPHANLVELHNRSFGIHRNNANNEKTRLDNLIGRLGVLEAEIANHFVENAENSRDLQEETIDFRIDAVNTLRSRMNDIRLLLHVENSFTTPNEQ